MQIFYARAEKNTCVWYLQTNLICKKIHNFPFNKKLLSLHQIINAK